MGVHRDQTLGGLGHVTSILSLEGPCPTSPRMEYKWHLIGCGLSWG